MPVQLRRKTGPLPGWPEIVRYRQTLSCFGRSTQGLAMVPLTDMPLHDTRGCPCHSR